MEIAATGLALPLFGPLRDQPSPRPDNRQQSPTRQPSANTTSTSVQSDVDGEQVLRGEVIYARPEPARTVDNVQRSARDSSAAFNFSGSRRFSLQAAIQTFRENESLVTGPGESRQVSGIIDEYV